MNHWTAAIQPVPLRIAVRAENGVTEAIALQNGGLAISKQ